MSDLHMKTQYVPTSIAGQFCVHKDVGAPTCSRIKWIKPPQQICDFSPHSLCNGSNSPPPSPLSLSLSLSCSLSSPPSLHPVLPSAFTFCSPPVREQILSSLRMTLQSVLQNMEGLSVGILFFFSCLFFFFYRYILSISHVVVSDWHARTPPRVKFKRLKVWHLNTVPAGSMFTHTWRGPRTHMRAFQHVVCDYLCKRPCTYVHPWP